MQILKASTASLVLHDLLRAESLMHRVCSELVGDLEFMETSGFQIQLNRAQLLSLVHSSSKV